MYVFLDISALFAESLICDIAEVKIRGRLMRIIGIDEGHVIDLDNGIFNEDRLLG